MRKFVNKILSLSLTLGLGFAVTSVGSALAGWEPKKPVEFIVMAGKGGGADKAVRFIQNIIAKNNLSSKPFTPVNKPGGSGAEALVHVKNASDPDHTLMFTLNSFYTTPLLQPGIGVDISTFTPVGRMAEDTFLLWVTKKSGIKNVDQFVKAAKAAGNKWIMAGTGKNSEDNILTDFLNKAYGLNMKYVPYKGGGRVAKELAGDNANSTVNNPSEQLGFYQAGKTVALGAFTDKRLPLFKEAPTFKEMGKNFVYYMQRTVVGAPGQSKGASAYYQGLFKKIYNSKEWQGYMKKKSLQGKFLTGDALMSYWLTQKGIQKGILQKMGAIK
ncbi:MAG: tripartite tricarboxylate transporter substrate-binding protein [Pseudomonadota bacterium]|mgnify:FL=1|nr:tripartite tricarboxylate transporter substrate-binding protein [Pseudomonadota bacterium]